MKKHLFKYLVLFYMLIPATLLAGWPVGKRHYVISASYSLFAANKSWDSVGTLRGDRGKFMAHSFSVSGIYGLGRNVDLSVNLPFSFLTSTSANGYSANTSGPGDLQVGLNFALKNFNYSNYISLYVGGILPLYKNTAVRSLGLGNSGATVKLMNTGGLGKKAYYDIQLGVNKYFGLNAPVQGTGDFTLGFKLSRWDQLTFNVGGVYSYSEDKSFSLNTFSVRDFAYAKGAIGYGHSFSKRFTLFASGFYTFIGRNSGQGYGGALTCMMKLPYYDRNKHEQYLK
ncbi:hypothetical protein EOD41_11045 [Mucilaginibacter limnophilus]|uniref:Type IX secretion system membrane protein PorP/SprF n=1 Tax=Mucilaginibacter limnophilus TaxID=1932778 RepID=A0A437MSA4_9SPHI|nr:hypothetical protein [Mucilaginibacter limnophilus]RVU00532.1 hypothetical protein EOD41_11045 [Mucilaginibacter limnophilus]